MQESKGSSIIILKLINSTKHFTSKIVNANYHFTARVNLATCNVVSCCTILMNFVVLVRILLGPYTYAGVVAFHYLQRITIVSYLTMIIFKMVMKTLFIIDFDKMASLSEQNVMVCMGVVTSVVTLIHLVLEALTRNNRGLDHYARWCLNTYLGKVVLYGKIFCPNANCLLNFREMFQ